MYLFQNVSVYGQEMPQSHTADHQRKAPRGKDTEH